MSQVFHRLQDSDGIDHYIDLRQVKMVTHDSIDNIVSISWTNPGQYGQTEMKFMVDPTFDGAEWMEKAMRGSIY